MAYDADLAQALATVELCKELALQGETLHEARVATLIRRAQNNIDRAHNRALDAVVETVSLTPDDANTVRLLKRKVRHADEFGAT